MPSAKRAQREATGDWEQLRMFVASPQQEAYELLRPIVLFGRTPAERARETGVAERTLRRKADRFDATGMASLFETTAPATNDRRGLPAEVRQAILDLKAEYAPLRPHEIATICEQRFRRPVSHHTVQRILAAGVPPTVVSELGVRIGTTAYAPLLRQRSVCSYAARIPPSSAAQRSWNCWRWSASDTCSPVVRCARKYWRCSSKAGQNRAADATLPNPRIG